jgi:signal transduction histidine kinase
MAVLGHDLRGPISTVRMSASSLLRELGNPDKAAVTIDRIRRGADRMAEMVSQLLDFTRTRLGSGFEIKKQRREVVSFMREILADFAVTHPERELVRDFPESVNADFDADRLRQAILNLLSNSGAYAPPHTPIVIRIAREPDALSITVENGGPPVPDDVRDKLFNPFARARKGGRSGGLGLGLYITQEIAKAHGGVVTFTSDEDATRFTLRLPQG